MTEGLDDFLEVSEETTDEVETPVETEAVEPAPRDEKGRFAPKGEPEAIEPQPSVTPTPEEAPIPVKALQEERRKRQELEARLAEYEARRPPEPVTPPDPWDEPDAHSQWLIQQAATVARHEALAEFENRQIARSANQARAKYQDYDDAVGIFSQMMQQNPALERQLRDHENPGEFAYTTAKTQMEIAQYGSIDALIQAKVKAETERLQAELKPAPTPPTIPNSLADQQSSRGGSTTYSPPSLDEILGR
jgi:type IV secretory pathway VirB10-like protein